ncbi:MAG TPA: MmgE/PrpD family protein [Bordetella sp.]|nr:MmgE/PrpD family protein [Bordetella sp.]
MQAGSPSGISQVLAQFVAACRWEDIPDPIRHEARRSLVNYFAVALAGAQDPTLDIAVATYGRFAAGQQAGLVGRPERFDMLNAAALNAMAANVYDFDDTHHPTIIHPTAPVAPALFALAQAQPMSGAELLLAFVLGVEVECRLGNAVSPGHYARGWHITSTCGVFGAAAAAGKSLMLAPEALVWALGSAASQAGGLVETLGTMAKSVGVGNAARNGLLSALLAQQGFDGPAAPLEGARGFLRVAADPPDLDAVTQDLGGHWQLGDNTYKPYPCGVVLNPVIDACLVLAGDRRLADAGLASIERITLTGHPLLRQRTDRPGVATGRESQVSAQHTVAAVLARGRAGLAEFSDAAVREPALRELGAKVVVHEDASYSVDGVQVRIALRGGMELEHRIEAARGSAGRPLSDRELEQKLRDLGCVGRPGWNPQPLIDALWHLDAARDAARVMALAA